MQRPKTVYNSSPRQLTQRMCGWGILVPEDRINFCENCAKRGEFTRAAAVAAFCLEMKAALDMLARGAKHAEEDGDKDEATKLTYIRMALAGEYGIRIILTSSNVANVDRLL